MTANEKKSEAKGLVSHPVDKLSGRIKVPGDKSISHRALMFGGLAVGDTTIRGLLEGEDVLATAAALAAMGCTIRREGDPSPPTWTVSGVGIGGLTPPRDVLDLHNAGTAARLLMGILASHNFTAFLTGDASLRSRPMGRVITPLEQMGARFVTSENRRLPLAVIGAAAPVPLRYDLPVASAQVKSAVLLAGLNTPGQTTVIERQRTRDHSERMLRHFGAEVTEQTGDQGEHIITVTGYPSLRAHHVVVPGDPSSAAFLAVAAALMPESDVTLVGVGVNPLRAGLYLCLEEMGVDLRRENPRIEGGEPVADLRIIGGRTLKPITVAADRAPSMIDEYPILAIAAAHCDGQSHMYGLGELRVKESDRLALMADGINLAGGKAEIGAADSLIISGNGKQLPGGVTIKTSLDHRIAMSFLVLGMRSAAPIRVDDGSPINTSFPGFAELMNGLGGKIFPDEE
ncbi:MAG: 3-phosphoshikimate 1-carboxyvinyltransferase [Candidatus Symbiobacter sp.]|nr:3-phosphoshikimate 1-carboxyvinyltransferase [Candidatus Symbiobacter sp.]